MEFKSNFNKLHFNLTSKFKDVSVKEKFNRELGNYIEISINEDIECKVLIKKSDLERDTFNWLYLTNPLKEDSSTIARVSSIDNFTDSISDIITNKRFDSEYLK